MPEIFDAATAAEALLTISELTDPHQRIQSTRQFIAHAAIDRLPESEVAEIGRRLGVPHTVTGRLNLVAAIVHQTASQPATLKAEAGDTGTDGLGSAAPAGSDERLARLRTWATRFDPEHPTWDHSYDGGCPWCRADRLRHDGDFDGNAHDSALELLDLIDHQRAEIDSLRARVDAATSTADRRVDGAAAAGAQQLAPADAGWPTDHLRDVERNLARLWNTIRAEDPDEDVIELRDNYAVGLRAVEESFAKARAAADSRLTRQEPPPERLGRLIEFLRQDLEAGVCRLDVVGGGLGSYDVSFEEAVGHVWDLWEPAEWRAGRPRMDNREAGNDIADRLSWDRLSPFSSDEEPSTRARLDDYARHSTADRGVSPSGPLANNGTPVEGEAR
jgi:hypothetical protein